ncbi:unnamed protein product [Durusdinium trenchii]|uniref:Endonuclease/exonuclease/phosphatase domain-containing protein n=1 Tax=Durusdinium trenchii TaxID=1381693 RepID=A0ABP0SXY3_9DINO
MDARNLVVLGLPLVSCFTIADAGVAKPLPLSKEAEMLAKLMQRPLKSSAQQMSVVSFNMLLKGFDQKPYYPSIPSTLRAWPWRKQQLEELIRGVDADVYCMQEVECSSFVEEFKFLAPAGYSAVPPKDDSKGKIPELAKCAIFFKTEKFEHIWQEHRSRVVLCALKCYDQVIYFASCHLEGAPSEGKTRLTQLRNALQSIQKDQKQRGLDPTTCAVIFAGDFNEDDSGPVVRSLASKRDKDDKDFEELVDHGFGLADLYSERFEARPPTFGAPPTRGTETKLRAIDFMFYTPRALRPVAIRAPFTPEQQQATIEHSIPAQWHFSDHVPLGGIFELTDLAKDHPEDAAIV